MGVVIAIVLLIAAFWLVFIVLRGIWRMLGDVGTTPRATTASRRPISPGMTAEEEGDVHNGPYGYSPATAYPETQYGSLFDPDAEWNHEEQ